MENQSSTPSPMHFLILEQVQFLKVNDDALLQWELVDVVDAEETDSDSSSPNDAPIEEIRHLLILPDAGLEDHRDGVDVDVDDDEKSEKDSVLGNGHYYYDDDDVDVDDDEDEDGYGLDDELVPWNVSNKFGRQRMRKLGKRAFSKMHNSKKSPYLFVRPGCVRGKHGLGLKHITDS
ncbi:uncharacterized protein LOC109798870 [Cajanus cajan]|uniref:Uncharacterized protein n=1 Tax=Cajanus cajan TaxID=3821 RepID=A0A151TMK7_CAJCA|nr:uncharacterized protein LOC109798870 [Cajanus cajan]KYP68257.1 hypothetical protein KK1_021877 [Cajanus cajan]